MLCLRTPLDTSSCSNCVRVLQYSCFSKIQPNLPESISLQHVQTTFFTTSIQFSHLPATEFSCFRTSSSNLTSPPHRQTTEGCLHRSLFHYSYLPSARILLFRPFRFGICTSTFDKHFYVHVMLPIRSHSRDNFCHPHLFQQQTLTQNTSKCTGNRMCFTAYTGGEQGTLPAAVCHRTSSAP